MVPVPISELVHTDSTHPAHANIYKILTLLVLRVIDCSYPRSGAPIYFIVEGCATLTPADPEEDPLDQSYFYEEHTCPTNFIRVEAIYTADDDDPHGLFEHVRSIWLTKDYAAAVERGEGDAWLREAFPETRQS